MRASIKRVLRDGTLVTVAFAIAIGWSLYSVAQGASTFVTTLLNEVPANNEELGISPIPRMHMARSPGGSEIGI